MMISIGLLSVDLAKYYTDFPEDSNVLREFLVEYFKSPAFYESEVITNVRAFYKKHKRMPCLFVTDDKKDIEAEVEYWRNAYIELQERIYHTENKIRDIIN